MAKVSIKCATCNSYIVDLHVLYDVIEEGLGSPDCKDPFNVFGRLQSKLEQGYDWWNVEFDWWDAEVAIILIGTAPAIRCLWKNPKKLKMVRLTLITRMVVYINSLAPKDIGHRQDQRIIFDKAIK